MTAAVRRVVARRQVTRDWSFPFRIHALLSRYRERANA